MSLLPGSLAITTLQTEYAEIGGQHCPKGRNTVCTWLRKLHIYHSIQVELGLYPYIQESVSTAAAG